MMKKSQYEIIGAASLLAGMTLAGWIAYNQRRPIIERVPLVKYGDKITIFGRNFGAQQGSSYLALRLENTHIKLREILEWADEKIVARFAGLETSGVVQVIKRAALLRWDSAPFPFVVQAADLPSPPYGYEVPVQADAPWPTFRRDHRNAACSPIAAEYRGDKPWSFQTGKGIFSTPIIDAAGTIYVGSADHYFYAINPNGTEKWRFETGEIIDSAGALLHDDMPVVVFPSGDGYLYYLHTVDGKLLRKFDARVAPRASYNNWFEGNIAVGYDGALYAGNTNFNYYAVNPNGTLRWTYQTGANAWSCAAFAADGTIFWASNDTKIRAVRPDGREKWARRTLGFLSASAAVGSDGTVYIGSFDSHFYALDPHTGAARWKFKTNDHIYGSAALRADADGNTVAIYFGSTDGIFYALSPAGELLWTYDTGAPIRSSPVLGRAPAGETGQIIYFGSGNGKLYALNAADGTRRWSFDTTSNDPELRDRNDLNGSPALGKTGVYIGGEHGQLWYVPYDYCLHVSDERGAIAAGEDLPTDAAKLLYVTPEGNAQPTESLTLPISTIVTLKLLVREKGETVNARVYSAPIGQPPDALRVRVEPEFPFTLEHSANGQYIHIIPNDFLAPDTTYAVEVTGNYYTDGFNIGNLTLGGRKGGEFRDTITFRTASLAAAQTPLTNAPHEVAAFELTRLAVPIPPMLPSLNQIGFDYIDWLVGAVAAGRGKGILWAIGARRDANGALVPDPASDFTLPFNGVYQGDAFIITNRDFTMPVTGIPIPFNTFQLRGQFGAELRVEPGATGYADTQVLAIPTFGPILALAGLANNWWEKLLAMCTYVTRPYAGAANRRPAGISVASLDYTAPTATRSGKVVATFTLAPGAVYPLAKHRPAILLIDAANTEAVYLNYHAKLRATADEAGNLATVTLKIPARTALPRQLEAMVILDVFPVKMQKVSK